ncbi:hypothetical protein Tco_1020157 [Tanacetum coccineum]|uniref:CCHC-type domain-containing protein n=1 Tax=Tanacetum coccineum TaxID=301880 RepID=A0ABQ5G1G4_9ASTR
MTNPYDATYHPQYQNPINSSYYNPVNQISSPSPPQPYSPSSVVQQPHHKYNQPASNLVIPTLHHGDDPLKYITKAMAFVSAMATRYPSTNNQLRNSSNPKNQATIQDGNATRAIKNNPAGQGKVIRFYNCQGERHMARQCTQPKRTRNSAWFQEKMLLVQAQENAQVLDEEQLAFLADPGSEDLNAYDPECDAISSAKVVLMANLSSCSSDVLSKVVKVRTTPDALTEGARGFKHTKAIFIKNLKDIFNAFDTNLINEITEVQTGFNQMQAAVEQYIVNIVVSSCAVNMDDYVDKKCSKCLELEAEPFKQNDMI